MSKIFKEIITDDEDILEDLEFEHVMDPDSLNNSYGIHIYYNVYMDVFSVHYTILLDNFNIDVALYVKIEENGYKYVKESTSKLDITLYNETKDYGRFSYEDYTEYI